MLQSGGQMAGVRFLKHNIRDDFDDLTDVARLYGIRAVPCFVFFIGGAQVWRPLRAAHVTLWRCLT